MLGMVPLNLSLYHVTITDSSHRLRLHGVVTIDKCSNMYTNISFHFHLFEKYDNI